MNPIPSLELDLTGINVNNRTIDEPHILSDRPTRSVTPKKGPFFAQGLIVKDNGVVLSRGKDYQLVELHQEATLKSGKEVCSVILIINKEVSQEITVTYQAIGGHYAYSDEPIARLYESLINDNRPIDWNTGVFNKPTEFNPRIHRHLLDDIYGFEPIVDYLERIKRAITLGQTSIVLEIVNSLLSKFECSELPKALPSNKLIQYDALLYFLSRRKILNNIWVDKKQCTWTKGQTSYIEIDTSGYPLGTNLYWQFYRQNDENVTLFTNKSGWVTANGGIVEVGIYVPSDLNITETNLYLGIKEHPDQEDFKAVTYVIDINEPVVTTSMYGYLLGGPEEGNAIDMPADIDSHDERRLFYLLTTY